MANTTPAQLAAEYYPTVSAVIVHGKKVLLRRDEQHYTWLSPSTHIGVDETPLDALLRLVKLETGLREQNLTALPTYQDNIALERDETEGTTQTMPFDVDIHREGRGNHFHVDSSYIFISNTDELTPEADKPPELRWFDAEELGDLVLTTKITMSRALYALNHHAKNDPSA